MAADDVSPAPSIFGLLGKEGYVGGIIRRKVNSGGDGPEPLRGTSNKISYQDFQRSVELHEVKAGMARETNNHWLFQPFGFCEPQAKTRPVARLSDSANRITRLWRLRRIPF